MQDIPVKIKSGKEQDRTSHDMKLAAQIIQQCYRREIENRMVIVAAILRSAGLLLEKRVPDQMVERRETAQKVRQRRETLQKVMPLLNNDRGYKLSRFTTIGQQQLLEVANDRGLMWFTTIVQKQLLDLAYSLQNCYLVDGERPRPDSESHAVSLWYNIVRLL